MNLKQFLKLSHIVFIVKSFFKNKEGAHNPPRYDAKFSNSNMSSLLVFLCVCAVAFLF